MAWEGFAIGRGWDVFEAQERKIVDLCKFGDCFFQKRNGEMGEKRADMCFFLAKTPENPQGEKRGDSNVNLPMQIYTLNEVGRCVMIFV